MNERIKLISVLVAGVLLSDIACADSGNNREREAIRRAQLQVMQMQGQMTALSADKDKLTQDLDKASGELKTAKAHAGQVGRKLADEEKKREAVEKELTDTKDALAKTQATLAETSRKLDETSARLAQTESQKTGLETAKAFRERQLASCEDKNKSLYQMGRDLMVRYEDKNCGEVLTDKEPFTGLSKVQTENMLEAFRDKLEDHRVVKAPGEE